MDGRGNKFMGKYTIQPHWPSDLKVLAGDVIRAKLQRQWAKNVVLTLEDQSCMKYCLDRYMAFDAELRRAKSRFEDRYYEYQQIGEV